MGYTTDFEGEFHLDKQLDKETKDYLLKFSKTRRMKRSFPNDEFGVDGEFFVGGTGDFGQDRDDSVVDSNLPPSTQPSLWCQWIPNEDGTIIIWDGNEKFYHYIEWIEYICNSFLTPKGYYLNGVVHWMGEEREDIGTIHILNNKIYTKEGGHFKSLVPNSIDFIKSKT